MPEKMTLDVNGRRHEVETDPKRSLLEVLREDLGLTGSKYGCGEAACGACSVIMDGEREFSCSISVGRAAGKKVTTIEGLSNGEALHPVQEAFLAEGAYQCGYCTAGMIMAAVALLDEKKNPSDEEIREGMNGNLCRCCGYPKIMSAIKRAAGAMAGGREVGR
jgi:aerobic-type carbon monoxide dehydrogenase small subunit (CoxS/CutS family)